MIRVNPLLGELPSVLGAQVVESLLQAGLSIMLKQGLQAASRQNNAILNSVEHPLVGPGELVELSFDAAHQGRAGHHADRSRLVRLLLQEPLLLQGSHVPPDCADVGQADGLADLSQAGGEAPVPRELADEVKDGLLPWRQRPHSAHLNSASNSTIIASMFLLSSGFPGRSPVLYRLCPGIASKCAARSDTILQVCPSGGQCARVFRLPSDNER